MLPPPPLPSFPTRRSSDLSACQVAAPLWPSGVMRPVARMAMKGFTEDVLVVWACTHARVRAGRAKHAHEDMPQYALSRLTPQRSEEHTSELQSPCNLVCRL